MGIKKEELSIAVKISETELGIPTYYGMTEDEVQYVIDVINEF